MNIIQEFRSFRQATPPNRGTDPANSAGACSTMQHSAAQFRNYDVLARSALSARLYPNGEFGIGYVPREKKSIEEKRQERGIVQGYQTFEEGRPHFLETGEILFDTTDMVTLVEPRLDITPELSQPPLRYGLKGITGYGRRCVRNIGYLMQEEFGKRRLSMATLTIPSLPPVQMQCIAENWAKIQKKFFQECKRRYERLKLPWRYVAVTEIQPKRWVERQEVGLHLHFLFPSFRVYKRGMFSLPHEWARKTWKRIIENTLNHISPSGDEPAVIPLPIYDCEPVRKDAVGYLAKYMSKGCDLIETVAEVAGDEYLPKQWWSADSVSKKKLKSSIIQSGGSMAEFLLSLCRQQDCPDILHLSFCVIPGMRVNAMSGHPEVVIVGYGGRVGMSMYRVLKKIHKKYG